SLADNTPIFSTAFFFPPQDHLYLDTDPDNMALLDELWDMDKDQTPVTTSAKEGKTVTIEDLVTCRIYPNPVKSLMNMEYELKTDADISFDLYTLEGLPVMKINRKKHATGLYQQTIDCSNLKPRSYVLKITVNNLTVNEIIIKK
ncbi:MAG: T9SS type A sorting domain-containing protein, partial [Prevotella sp.]|nr:T9SS type A sorting domain-containing protein [Prevotella sp.]